MAWIKGFVRYWPSNTLRWTCINLGLSLEIVTCCSKSSNNFSASSWSSPPWPNESSYTSLAVRGITFLHSTHHWYLVGNSMVCTLVCRYIEMGWESSTWKWSREKRLQPFGYICIGHIHNAIELVMTMTWPWHLPQTFEARLFLSRRTVLLIWSLQYQGRLEFGSPQHESSYPEQPW